MTQSLEELKHLGSKSEIPKTPSMSILDVFDNPAPENQPYTISLETSEFTSLCPKTGQPDFANIRIDYVPAKKCIETKSLKLYLFSYRNYEGFMEAITNQIAQHLVDTLQPLKLGVTAAFSTRGGIRPVIAVEYQGKHQPSLVTHPGPFGMQ